MICRLCLKDCNEFIHIFGKAGIEMLMTEIIAKHFWFEPKSDDPISTSICDACWTKTSDFNEFYNLVEEAHRLLTERFSLSLNKQKTTSPIVAATAAAAKSSKNSEISVVNSPPPTTKDRTSVVDIDVEVRNGISNVSNYKILEMEKSDCFIYTTNGDRLDVVTTEGHEVLVEFEENEDYQQIDVNDDDDNNYVEDVIHTKKQSTQKVSNVQQATEKFQACRRSTRAFPSKNLVADESPKSGVTQKIVEITKQPKKLSVVSRNRVCKTKGKAADTVPLDGNEGKKNRSMEKCQKLDECIAKYMRLSCEICNMECEKFPELRKHMESAHNIGRGYVTCCNKKFYKRALLATHVERHLNPDSYKCEECDKVLADKHTMRNHMLLKHQPEDEKKFECSHCSKKFAKQYLLEQHRQRHEKPTHMCTICQKGFATHNFLANHNKMVHEKYGTMCDICAKVIRGRAAFARHQLEHQGVEVPKIQCDICGSWHKDKYSLQKHKRRHNESGEEHICDVCGKSSPNRSALLSHKRFVHKSQRAFECSVCKKSFKTSVTLKEHMATHTGEVLYKCPHCTRTFNSNANMHAHRKRLHPKEFEEARRNRKQNKMLNSSKENVESSNSKAIVTASGKCSETNEITQISFINTEKGENLTSNSIESTKNESHTVLLFTDGNIDIDDQAADSIIFAVD